MLHKTLVIADVHTHVDTVQEIIDKEKPTRTIFLGDWFDCFGDTPGTNMRAAEWLLNRMRSVPDDIFLWGNHDLHYAYPGSHTRCSGFDSLKLAAIGSIIPTAAWERFKWFHMQDNWLFTHAGLVKSHVPADVSSAVQLSAFLAEESEKASLALRRRYEHWFFEAGMSRGGRAVFGGLVWADYSEFIPIDGINQLFGHTCGADVRAQTTPTSMNYCIDCRRGGVYAFFHGEEFVSPVLITDHNLPAAAHQTRRRD